MGRYIMYNGYNSPNQYLANYKDKFSGKSWGGSLKTEEANCGGDEKCEGRTLKKHQDESFKNINKILKNGFPSDNAGDDIYKKENYFQKTDFVCNDNLENEFFSYPMMCGDGQSCPRYNYIINNRTGSANLLKNLYENNNVTLDTTINTEDLIIPALNAQSVVGVISYDHIIQKLSYTPNNGNSTQLTISGEPFCDIYASKFPLTITDTNMKVGNNIGTIPVKINLSNNTLSHTLTITVDDNDAYLESVCGDAGGDEHEAWLTNLPNDNTEMDDWTMDTWTMDDWTTVWMELAQIRIVDKDGDFQMRWWIEKELKHLRVTPPSTRKIISEWSVPDHNKFMKEILATMSATPTADTEWSKAEQALSIKIWLTNTIDFISNSKQKILLLNVEFKNYLPEALSGFNNTYLLDNLFDTDITCKSITLPAGGECQTRHIHTKDYEYITKNHPNLVNICATQTGFALENITVENITMQNITKNKFYAKLFLGTFGMLILYMLYRIDKKRKN